MGLEEYYGNISTSGSNNIYDGILVEKNPHLVYYVARIWGGGGLKMIETRRNYELTVQQIDS